MEITPEYLDAVRGNRRLRQRLAFEHPLWFGLLYLRHHFRHPFAPFHIEMFHLLQHEEQRFIAVMAFRDSGKSTILNMTNVLWSILGKPKKKFAIVMSKTQEQAKNHFANIKAELESNEALREDFGPFTANEGAWNKTILGTRVSRGKDPFRYARPECARTEIRPVSTRPRHLRRYRRRR